MTTTPDPRNATPPAAASTTLSPSPASVGRSARRVSLATRVHTRLLAATESGSDRGDVPGWVLVTVVTVV